MLTVQFERLESSVGFVHVDKILTNLVETEESVIEHMESIPGIVTVHFIDQYTLQVTRGILFLWRDLERQMFERLLMLSEETHGRQLVTFQTKPDGSQAVIIDRI